MAHEFSSSEGKLLQTAILRLLTYFLHHDNSHKKTIPDDNITSSDYELRIRTCSTQVC